MRKSIKVLLLGALTIGMAAGCDWGKSSETTTSQEPSSQSTSAVTSSDSKTDSTTSTTSSLPTSSTTSVIPTSTTTSVVPVPPSLTGITLDTTNVKKEYKYGDALDLTGLVVTAKYSDNTSTNVTDYRSNPANGAALRYFGVKEITVSYQSFSEKFNVTVNATVMNITLNTDAVKKEYHVGDTLDLTGLVVTANYNNNTKAVVTDYTTTPASGSEFETTGEKVITVSYEGKNAEYTVNVLPAIKKAWTEEEAKIMSDHLHGVVLPYTGFEQSVVSYDEEHDCIFIEGGTLTATSLDDYAKLMVAAGFTRLESTVYLFEKSVATTEGTRYVRVAFDANEGQFILQAIDPYYYSFPRAFAQAYAEQVIGSEDVIPSLPGANYYETNSTYLVIFCYLESITEDAGYTEILRAAGWRIDSEKDEYGYYVAVAPDYSYQVSYIYQTKYHRLAIYFENVGKWQPSFFEEFFTENSTYNVQIPEFKGKDKVTYLFMVSGESAIVGVQGATTKDVENYAETVKTAGWEVTYNEQYENYKAKLTIPGVGIANMTFYYNPQISSAVLIIDGTIYPLPTAVFPSEDIAEILGEEITDVVPAYQGQAEGYAIEKDGLDHAVRVSVTKGTEKACAAAYIEYIKTQGYKLEEDCEDTYISPNLQIYIQANGIDNSGIFSIKFYLVPYTLDWPSAKISEFLGEDVKDIVPVFEHEAVKSYEFEIDDDGSWVKVNFDYEADVDIDEMVELYAQTLLDNDYFELVRDEEDPDIVCYSSKNYEVIIAPQNFLDDLWILFNTPANMNAEGWPTYDLAYFMLTSKYSDPLPVYEDYDSIEYSKTRSSFTIDVALDTEDAEELKAAADNYVNQLEEEGFEFLLEMDEGTCRTYTSPNKEYEVSVMYQSDGFTIQIDEIANESKKTTTFPTEDLFADHPELKDVLPIVVEGEATFDTRIQDAWVEIFVIYEDINMISPAMQAYAEALTEAGFRPQENTAGYDVVYFSPDETYYVALSDWSTYDPTGFDIEIYWVD